MAKRTKRPASPMSAKRNDKWIVIGPGGGGGQFYPTISPHDPNVVFIRCDMTGSYLTKDGGETWRMFNLRATGSWYAFDPVRPRVYYAYVHGLWRSVNAGKSWDLVYPNAKQTKGITVTGDHAQWEWDLGSAKYEPMLTMAVDPDNSKRMYAVIARTLMQSKDWGETWTPVKMNGPGQPALEADYNGVTREMQRAFARVYVDPRSPKRKRTLYVIGARSVSVREGGKWTHHAAAPGVERFFDAALGWPEEGGRPWVYATAPAQWKDGKLTGGVMYSHDGGATWRTANEAFEAAAKRGATHPPRFPAIATCLADPRVAYVSYREIKFDDSPEDHYMGVAKTEDGGVTWRLAIKDTLHVPAPNEHDAWTNEVYGPYWGENPLCLGVAPNDPDVCYGSDLGRTMKTTDGLKTWAGAYSKKHGDGWATTGLDVTTCYGVHRDPLRPERLFITYTDIGMFRSEDGGATWHHAAQGITEHGWGNTSYWMVFDPEVKGRAWSGWGSNHDLPRPKMWRGRKDVSHYRGGAAISEDGGRTWAISNAGMRQTDVTHIVLDPKSPKESRTLYATGFGTGVWKSVDGGKSWSLKRNGLKGAEPFAWRLAMDRDGVLYLVCARRSDDGGYGNEMDGALYRSRDGAETWQEIALPEGVNGPNGVLVDAEDPRRLFVACWGRNVAGGAKDGGVIMSQDGGATWRKVFEANQYVYDVTADPRDPRVMYLCGFESSAYRSDDRGETWKRIKGFNFKWGHRVVPDTTDAGKVFVTTFGGSVWYGPAEGDPKAVEDVGTEHLTYEALGH